ncbi:hypothetical protein CIB48_g1302 [Xylaria polymorpha]|nr:hypothetical protein CIB48_g1302 [Xylaria polymorpha]
MLLVFEPARGKGLIPFTMYMRQYRVGDFIDIKRNAAMQKGVPFKSGQPAASHPPHVTTASLVGNTPETVTLIPYETNANTDDAWN